MSDEVRRVFKQYSVHGPQFPIGKRVARTAVAAIMAGLLAFPNVALAAEMVYVGDDGYTEASSGSGSNGGSWAWDGADNMVLNNYDGGSIGAVGDLSVELIGNNNVTVETGPAYEQYGDVQVAYGVYAKSESGEDADLTLTGSGSLSITGNGEIQNDNGAEGLAIGVYGSGTNVTVDNTRVNIDLSNSGYSMQTGIVADRADVNIINGSRVIVNATGDSYNRGDSYEFGIGAWGYEGGKLRILDSTVESKSVGGYGLYGSSTDADGVYIENSDITAQGSGHAIYSEGGMSLINSDIAAVATSAVSSGEIVAEAEEGASQGAAIAARGGIVLQNVNLVGARVAVDENGISYVVNADGSTGSVVAKHTGAASKFVNGVGREKTPMSGGGSASGGSVSGSTADGSVRTASTGGGLLQMVADALSRTFDHTSFGPAVAAALAAAAALTASASMRKRNGLRAE